LPARPFGGDDVLHKHDVKIEVARTARCTGRCQLDSPAVDSFALVLLAGLAILVLWVWMLGRANQGRSMEPFGLRSARQISEDREELEAEDLAQMLEAHNARRRRRGEPDVTVADLERRVMEDFNEQRRRREAYLADRDLDELLEATNARRRARGLPERTREEVQREFGSGSPGGT
jgi:hypothetical protein